MAQIILSMDLSLNGSAFAVVEYYQKKKQFKVLETVYVNNNKIDKENIGEKLYRIANTVEELLSRYDIDIVAKERGFSRFNNATQMLYRVHGVIEYVIYMYKLNDIRDVAPTTVKKEVTGKGNATKKHVAEGLKDYIINFEVVEQLKTDDETDAIAIAIASVLNR